MPLTTYRIANEPFYRPVADEIALFEAAWHHRLPVMLKGPTGCGKTRFVEHMAWRLGRPLELSIADVTPVCENSTPTFQAAPASAASVIQVLLRAAEDNSAAAQKNPRPRRPGRGLHHP
jgi:ATP-dependent protease Clp ATPase subunit